MLSPHLQSPSSSSSSDSGNDLSEIEGGFSLLEKGDFTASWACVVINDSQQTGAGTGFKIKILFFFYFIFFFTIAASKSCPLVLNHLTYSLEQIDSALQEKPNHSQSIFLAFRCFKSGRGLDLRVSFLN